MENPFKRLVPPTGGVKGLRRKLDALENQRFVDNAWARARLAVVAVTACFLLVVGYSIRPVKSPSSQNYGIFQRYMEVPSAKAVSLIGTENSRLRLVQQPSDNPMISLYWIEEVED